MDSTLERRLENYKLEMAIVGHAIAWRTHLKLICGDQAANIFDANLKNSVDELIKFRNGGGK